MAHVYLPLARTKDLVSQDVDGEVLVFDMHTNRAIRLNATAAEVWRKADGTRSVEQIAAALGLDRAADVSEDLVWLALDLLEKEGLIDAPAGDTPRKVMSRREVGMRLGAAALLLLPMVSKLTVPAAAQVGGSIAPAACASCVVLSSGDPSPCATVSDGLGGQVDCSTYTGLCHNGNSCNAGGTPATTTCSACASQVFGGGGQNNAWHSGAV